MMTTRRRLVTQTATFDHTPVHRGQSIHGVYVTLRNVHVLGCGGDEVTQIYFPHQHLDQLRQFQEVVGKAIQALAPQPRTDPVW